jgi:hypothetical protein
MIGHHYIKAFILFYCYINFFNFFNHYYIYHYIHYDPSYKIRKIYSICYIIMFYRKGVSTTKL